MDQQTDTNQGQLASTGNTSPVVSQAEIIGHLLEKDSRQAQTQTEPSDVPTSNLGIGAETEAQRLPEVVGECYRVRAITDKPKKANPALRALIDLSNIELKEAQDTDPDLRLIKDMLNAGLDRPPWKQVRTESMDAKNLRSQYPQLRMQDGVLLRRRKNQGPLDDWQVVAPQTIKTKIFQACHHHKLAAHQGVVRTLTLIKLRFYCPNMHKDVEAWCQRCAVCGKCKAAVHKYGQWRQPTYGAFNERVSIDLMGLFKKTQNNNDYIVVMQDHFTKWVEGCAVCGKEALTLADAVVQEWVLKYGTPIAP